MIEQENINMRITERRLRQLIKQVLIAEQNKLDEGVMTDIKDLGIGGLAIVGAMQLIGLLGGLNKTTAPQVDQIVAQVAQAGVTDGQITKLTRSQNEMLAQYAKDLAKIKSQREAIEAGVASMGEEIDGTFNQMEEDGIPKYKKGTKYEETGYYDTY
jgi:hypothetical protein